MGAPQWDPYLRIGQYRYVFFGWMIDFQVLTITNCIELLASFVGMYVYYSIVQVSVQVPEVKTSGDGSLINSDSEVSLNTPHRIGNGKIVQTKLP